MYETNGPYAVAFATLPEAMYHAHQVTEGRVTLMHATVTEDPMSPAIGLSTPDACDRTGLPAHGSARWQAIECGIFLVHRHSLDSVRRFAPSVEVPIPSTTHTDWVDITRANDAQPQSPGSAARE